MSTRHKAQFTIQISAPPQGRQIHLIFLLFGLASHIISTPPQTKGYQQEGETKNTHTYFHLKYLIQVPHQAKCQNLVQIV